MKTKMQNPKSEGRGPKSCLAGRRPKSERDRLRPLNHLDFGARSAFGFRNPVFGFLLLLLALNPQLSTWAQGTAFTYHGRLASGTNVANGRYDLVFTLFSVNSGGVPGVAGPITNAAVGVTNGLFTTTLDFGANFPGADRWLETAVRTNGTGAFTTLNPRQQLTPTPYAITASNLTGTVPATGLAGTYSSAVTFNNPANSYSGSGAGLTGLNASQLSSGGVPGAALVGTYPNAVTFNNAANSFSGSGAGLTGLNASQLSSGGVPGAALVGAYPNAVTFNNAANSFSGSGAGLTSLDANQISSGGVPGAALSNAWKSTGNSGTLPGTHFIGTTDNQPLELKVNGVRALRFEPNGAGAANLIGGYSQNIASASFSSVIAGGGTSGSINQTTGNYASVGGGHGNTAAAFAHVGGGAYNTANGSSSVIGGGQSNLVSSAGALISGGETNAIQTGATDATIGGGHHNVIQITALESSIAGGSFNSILTNAQVAAIGGGTGNTIGTNASAAVIGGGYHNTLQNNAYDSTIAGGYSNSISGPYAVIPGGDLNAAAQNSFAAGHRAKANHSGAFVWADSTEADFATTGTNQFLLRATGGVGIGLNQPTNKLHVAGGVSATAFVTTSDCNAKENFIAVSPREILDKVAALPISRWNYKTMHDGSHLGPTAQDFYAAFGLGGSDRTITTVDPDGVALAAIQGLNEKLADELKRRDAENAVLKQRLDALEQIFLSQTSN